MHLYNKNNGETFIPTYATTFSPISTYTSKSTLPSYKLTLSLPTSLAKKFRTLNPTLTFEAKIFMRVQIGEDIIYQSLTSGSQQIKELVLILDQQFSS
jgi:hypothetical protein